MNCRVVFPAAAKFRGLEDFFEYSKKLLAKARDGKYDATFYLFGEDMLGVLELCDEDPASGVAALILGEKYAMERRRRREALLQSRLVTHERVISCISRLQKLLLPSESIIFSLYSRVSDGLFNSVYLAGKDNWSFDFKRHAVDSDRMNLGLWTQAEWRVASELNVKTKKCVKAGGVCIKNLHVFVCADISLVPSTKLAAGSLVFVPAWRLPFGDVLSTLKSANGSKGHVFINDPESGWSYGAPFGTGSNGNKPAYFGRKKFLSVDFEAPTEHSSGQGTPSRDSRTPRSRAGSCRAPTPS